MPGEVAPRGPGPTPTAPHAVPEHASAAHNGEGRSMPSPLRTAWQGTVPRPRSTLGRAAGPRSSRGRRPEWDRQAPCRSPADRQPGARSCGTPRRRRRRIKADAPPPAPAAKPAERTQVEPGFPGPVASWRARPDAARASGNGARKAAAQIQNKIAGSEAAGGDRREPVERNAYSAGDLVRRRESSPFRASMSGCRKGWAAIQAAAARVSGSSAAGARYS